MTSAIIEPAAASAAASPLTVYGGSAVQSFAITSAKTTLPSSDGWKRKKPRLNQLCAPLAVCPIISSSASIASIAPNIGHANRIALR